jgi:hypothetical protein
VSEDVRMQGAPVFTLDDLTNDQLRDLILQAFGQLSINEEIPLVDLIEECYNEVKQEVEGTAGKT